MSVIKQAAWAPLAVLVLHQTVNQMGWRSHTDWLMHLTGGMAITWFAASVLTHFRHLLGELTPVGTVIHSFGLGCTAAILWEIGEFVLDQITGSSIQHSLYETLMDEVYSVSGALIVAVLLGVVAYKKKMDSRGRSER